MVEEDMKRLEKETQLSTYGIRECDCPHPGVDWDEANKYLAENYSLDEEERVPCGCGEETIYFFDLGETLHFEDKHWHQWCLMVELADRLFRELRERSLDN